MSKNACEGEGAKGSPQSSDAGDSLVQNWSMTQSVLFKPELFEELHDQLLAYHSSVFFSDSNDIIYCNKSDHKLGENTI